jgi:NADPH:quinone reductase-like Zn-dependent oxidoreductase
MHPTHNVELQSLVTASGELRLELVDTSVPPLASEDVLVRVEASPLNPSDQGLMFAAADLATGTVSGPAERPVFTARIPPERMGSIQGRIGQALVVGNEAAGSVIAAGDGTAAKALLGRRVAVFGGGLYAEYRCVKADQCMPLPDDTPFTSAASCFINPLTALGMVETLRIEGHTAMVHTAGASNLGQMLVRICQEDGVGLVAVVRSAEQEALLRTMGVRHVCNVRSTEFDRTLRNAVASTGATIAFDASGGGTLAGQILAAMEQAIGARTSSSYSRYGSMVHKQVYIYGSLDTGPTTVHRSFGFSWGIGGWLLWPFLNRIGAERTKELKARIVAGLASTFKSHYAGTLSLAEVLDPAMIARYAKRSTGLKYLVTPHDREVH